ncbi:MAG: phospho-N-acetylmuramoyl-pentapeptide-transferase [Desulfatiglandales bacterium]
MLATLTSIIFCIIFGKTTIEILKKLQIGQYIRDDGPKDHFSKKGTPTMGGILIIASILFANILWIDFKNKLFLITLFVFLSFACIGFYDDYLKNIRKNSKGLSAKRKFFLQILAATVASLLLYFNDLVPSFLNFPFFKNVRPELDFFYIPLMVFIIVGASNAVNLTDGLDGLAIGPTIIAFLCYSVFSYVAGHAKIAQYLQIPYVPGAGEMTVMCGAVIGAGLGFLWFNSYPAEIFMGDVGSLSLGALLGTVAIITKQEIVLILVGGIFVFETVSVILQVWYFKSTNGKRIFRMAPIHHHFELKGWPEPKVIVRFWIIAIILGLLSMTTLKLR